MNFADLTDQEKELIFSDQMKLDLLTRRCQQFLGKFGEDQVMREKRQQEEKQKMFEKRLRREIGDAQYENLKSQGKLPTPFSTSDEPSTVKLDTSKEQQDKQKMKPKKKQKGNEF